nr:uncharacterized protein LOC127328633 [Lolium perenne]
MAHLHLGPQVAQPPGRRKTGGSHHATAAPRHPPDPRTSTQLLRRGTARPPTTHAQSRRRSRRGEDAHPGRRPASPTPAEKMPAPGTSSTSTLHEQHLLPSEPAKPKNGPPRANTGAPPKLDAGRTQQHAGRRRAIVAARSSPQRPPSSHGLQQRLPRRRSLMRARGCAENAFPGPPPRASAPDPAAPTPASPAAPAAEGRKRRRRDARRDPRRRPQPHELCPSERSGGGGGEGGGGGG